MRRQGGDGESPTIDHSRRRTRRCRGDDGAVIVEAALVVPILVALLAGVVDVGVGFRDRLTMQGAVRTAGRIGASSQQAGNADRSILTGLNASINSAQNFKVDRVVIFYSQPVLSPASPADITPLCKNTVPSGSGSGFAGLCNIYSLPQMQNAANGTGALPTAATVTACGTNWDQFWCPANRKIQLTDNSNLGPDYLGVYVVATYTPFTRIYKSSVIMVDQVVVRLEPAQ